MLESWKPTGANHQVCCLETSATLAACVVLSFHVLLVDVVKAPDTLAICNVLSCYLLPFHNIKVPDTLATCIVLSLHALLLDVNKMPDTGFMHYPDWQSRRPFKAAYAGYQSSNRSRFREHSADRASGLSALCSQKRLQLEL